MNTTTKPPTILATSGGVIRAVRRMFDPGPLLWHAIALAEAPRRPALAVLNTAQGDPAWLNAEVHQAFYGTDVEVTCVNLLPMPNFEDVRGHLLSRDVIWVGGGSVAGLLALWRLHGWDEILRECWEAGVVLAGVSAGSLCWHVGGPTDSFGPRLRSISNGLGFLPYSNGVHYDAEEQRRPLLQQLVADGSLPTGHAADNGVGLLYRGTELVEAVSERVGAGAYLVKRGPDNSVTETRIEPRLLPGALPS